VLNEAVLRTMSTRPRAKGGQGFFQKFSKEGEDQSKGIDLTIYQRCRMLAASSYKL
jgi:hypothetical protein